MVGERLRPRVAAVLPVHVEEVAAEVRAPQPFQVHGQEGDVGESVAESQLLVEVEAVEDSGTIGEAEDVVDEQVPWRLADDRLPGVDDAAAPFTLHPCDSGLHVIASKATTALRVAASSFVPSLCGTRCDRRRVGS